MSNDNIVRSRNWNIVLYPDNELHIIAMEYIKTHCKYCAILHDKDIDSHGYIKKSHWHIVLMFPNAVTNTSLIKHLGVETNLITDKQKCINTDKCLEYLIHYNNIEKFQYNINECFGDLCSHLRELINKHGRSEGDCILTILEFIDSNDDIIEFSQFIKWIASNGLWAEYRRAQLTFIKYLEEHNKNF